MATYYGVIYFKDGSKKELSRCSGPGADKTAERQAAMAFEQCMKHAASDRFKPTRYEVKEAK